MREPADQPSDARPAVQQMLQQAIEQRASDVHLEPTADHIELRYRIDGHLHTISRLDTFVGRSYINCLMVMAQMLSYRRDIPQEGRFALSVNSSGRALDLRLAIMPTTHGLRGVVRLPAEFVQPHTLEELDLPPSARELIDAFINNESGMMLVCGPAGSGKTTTIYSVLGRMMEAWPGLSVISLEDPVERDIEGVTQIQVTPFGELTYEKSLRSILRQDPQVLALGEIRDSETASIAVQAALSGHRLIATLHAGTPQSACIRLIEMGIQPYQLASAMHGVLALRLLRRGSEQTGYHGRIPVAEALHVDEPVRQALLSCADRDTLRTVIEQQPGFSSFAQNARQLMNDDATDRTEVQRVLGAGKVEPQ